MQRKTEPVIQEVTVSVFTYNKKSGRHSAKPSRMLTVPVFCRYPYDVDMDVLREQVRRADTKYKPQDDIRIEAISRVKCFPLSRASTFEFKTSQGKYLSAEDTITLGEAGKMLAHVTELCMTLLGQELLPKERIEKFQKELKDNVINI